MPGLIQVQLDSFEWFKQEGLREVFEEISPYELTESATFPSRRCCVPSPTLRRTA